MRATAILNTIRRFLLFLNRKPIEGPGTSYQIGSPRVERASPLPSRTLQRQSVTAAVGLVAFLAFAMFSISCGGGGATNAAPATFNPPAASLSPASLSFGAQPVESSSSAKTVTLTNSGNTALSITSLAVSGSSANNFVESDNCGSSVAAGANCAINVTFKPVTPGTATATLNVVDNASANPQSVSLSGTGAAAAVSLSPASLSFGSLALGTVSAAQTIILINSGNAALSIAGLAVSGANAGNFIETNNCGGSLAAGANCTINVTFTPSAIGAAAATLNISDNVSGSPQTVSLSGTGASTAPVITVSPVSLAFGSLSVGTTSPAQTITLTNSGTAALSITSLAVSGSSASNFVESDNCGSSVAAGANCSINITFTPSASGPVTAALYIADNVSGSPQTVSLSGTGTAAAVSLSPASLAFGNLAIGTVSAAQTTTLTNSGNAALSISGLSVYGANAGNFVETNNCGNSVAAGANCTISVTFKPSASGAATATLGVADNASGSPQTVSLSGTGTAAAVSLSPSSLIFGSLAIGTTSAAQTITMSNPGNAALSITGLALSGANASNFVETNTCGSSVAAGANCTIGVTFKPSASGAATAALSIADNLSGSPQSVSLSGTGTSTAPAVSLSPASLAFGSLAVGATSPAQTITLTNSGNAALSITGLALSGSNASNFTQTNNCGSSVAVGANCTISVTFTASTSGAASAALSIADNLSGSPQTVSLSGTGTAAAVSLSPSSLIFGSLAIGTTSAAQTITLSNPGNAALSITGLAVSGANASNFVETNTCGSSVAAGANCTISVTFKPSASGAATAALSIADNLSGSPQSVSLSGTGTSTAPAVSLSPASLAFGSVAVGATSPAQTFTLTNSGNAALSITGFALSGSNASNFTQTNNCGSSVAVGANCTISVTFKPSTSGAATAALNISDNVSGSPQSVSLSGTGAASSASLSPTSLTFASQTVGASGAAQTITLTNSGNAALSVTSIAVSGANASDFAETNNCGSSVAAGANCAISVTFKPTAAGTRTAAVTLTDNAAGSPQSVSLSGTGAAPAANLSPTSLSFGNEAVDMVSTSQVVTLSNTGSASLSISSITFTGADATDFTEVDTCSPAVAAGGTCTIAILFTPAASGTRTAALSITDNASGSPQSVALSGSGTHDVMLSWTASTTPGVMGYNIYRGTTSGGESATPLNSSPVCSTTLRTRMSRQVLCTTIM